MCITDLPSRPYNMSDLFYVKGMLAALYGDTVSATASSRAQGDDVCVTNVAVALTS